MICLFVHLLVTFFQLSSPLAIIANERNRNKCAIIKVYRIYHIFDGVDTILGIKISKVFNSLLTKMADKVQLYTQNLFSQDVQIAFMHMFVLHIITFWESGGHIYSWLACHVNIYRTLFPLQVMIDNNRDEFFPVRQIWGLETIIYPQCTGGSALHPGTEKLLLYSRGSPWTWYEFCRIYFVKHRL